MLDFKLLIIEFFTKTISRQVYIFIFCILSLTIIIRIKKGWEIRRVTVINFLFHIVLVTILGFAIKLLNNQTILSLLLDYWKIALFFFLLITTIFIKECLIYSKTINQISQSYCRAVYLLLLSVLFTVITNNLNYTWGLIIIITMFFMWSISNSEQINKDNATNDLHSETIDQASDVPIQYFEHLFPTRKKEFIRIYDYLKNIDTVDPYAMAISANWGEGKTSLINALQEKLKSDNNEVIYLQPMILDTREKLLSYVFDQLETILTNNRIYTGKGSPYKKYFELLMKFVNYKTIISFSSFFDIFPENKKEDLRELKKNLEENIEKLSEKNEKIYIIVDDLDRVENETVYNTLTFIKEIVDLKRITVLFLVDYKNIMSDKITIEYLEKFIHQKFDLAKIDTNELFDHYIKYLIPLYKTNLINEEVNILRESFEEYLNVFYDDIQDKIQNKEKINNKSEENEKYNIEIRNLNRQLNEFKNKLSNARYVKKIVISIKETFDYLEKKLGEEKIINIENKELKISELIFSFNIFKNLFKEHHDELLRIGNFKSFLSDTGDEFIAALFREQRNKILFENEQILRETKYDFYNAIMFSDEISHEFFYKIKNENEKLLEDLDSYTNYLIISNIEDLKKYLKAINYAHEEIDEVLNKRIKKFTNLVITSIKNNLIELHQIFELFDKSNRNILIHCPYFYKEINKYLDCSQIEFSNKKSKDISLYILENMEYALIFKIEQSILMLLRLYFLSSNSLSKDSLYKINKLDQLNKIIAEALNIQDLNQELGSIDYFEKLLEIINNKILLNVKKDNLALKGYKHFKSNIDNFIEVYKLKAITYQKVSETPLNKKVMFEITNDVLSAEDLIGQLDNLYTYVVKNKNEPNQQIFHFFYQLLNNIDKKIFKDENEKFSKSYFIKLKEISIYLNKFFEANKGIYHKDYWYFCTIKLNEIDRGI